MKERPKDTLRKKAERNLSKKKGALTEIPSGNMKKLVHELQVHQIELEMQNEELRKAQVEIERSRSKYVDLYDFSPAGYYIFDQMGIIKELNLAGARLLGVERSFIIDKPFQPFVDREYADTFIHHRLSVLRNGDRQSCGLKLVRMDKSSFYVSMESVPTNDGEGKSKWVRSAIIDITELKKKEQMLLESENRLQLLSSQLLRAQEEERKRIAGEIHDSIGASLAAAKFKVEDVLNEIGDRNSQAGVALRDVLQILQGTIEDSRRIQMFLRPSLLDDLGILPTINWFCRQFQSTYPRIRINQEFNIQEHDVPEPLKIVIYRTLQEALNNVAKHSKAPEVLLRLRIAKTGIQLDIQDSGQGFDLREAHSRKGTNKGLGLESMRERVELSGGFFSVESSEGAGTAITAEWATEQVST